MPSEYKPNFCEITCLRHGETLGGNYYRGSTDDTLSDLGWGQMDAATANRNWDVINTSPLRRCLDFAQHYAKKSNTPLRIDRNLQEIDFGDWEGKTYQQIARVQLQQFYQDPSNTPPNGEPFGDFVARIDRATAKIIAQFPNQRVLIITHAGCLRALFYLWLKLPVDKLCNINIAHGSLTCFQYFTDNTTPFASLQFCNLTLPLNTKGDG